MKLRNSRTLCNTCTTIPKFKNYSASQPITRHQMICMFHFPKFFPSQVFHSLHSSAQSLHKISPRPLSTSHMTIMNLYLYCTTLVPTLTLFKMSDSSCLPYHLYPSCSLFHPHIPSPFLGFSTFRSTSSQRATSNSPP